MSASTTIGRSVARAHAADALDHLRPADQPDVGQAEVVRGRRVAAVVERLDAGPLRDPRGEAVVRTEGDDGARLGEAGAKAGRHADPPDRGRGRSRRARWARARSLSRARSATVADRVDGAPVDDDAVVAQRDLVRDEVAEHVPEHELRIALERVAPAAGARRPEDQRVAGIDGNLVDLRHELDDLAGCADERLRAAATVASAVDPPRRDRGAVVVHRERPGPGEHVRLLDAGAAAVEPGAPGVARGLVARDPHRVVALGVLRRGRPEERPPRVPVEAVRLVPGREPAEEKLDELEVLAVGVVPGEDEERARPVSRRHRELRRLLAERPAHAVEEARVDVQPVRQRRRELRVQERPFRQRDLEDVVEPVVEQDLGIEGHDHVDPEEELAEALVDVEVDRPGRLVGRARPVGVADVALPPDRQHHLEGAVAAPVVVDPVGERLGLLRDVRADDVRHRAPRPLEQRIARHLERLRPEALADLDDPPLRRAAAADDRHQVAPVRVRRARVVEDHVERRLVEDAPVEDLDRRDPDALLPDRERVGDLAARHLAAHVHHVAEERANATCSPSWKTGRITSQSLQWEIEPLQR